MIKKLLSLSLICVATIGSAQQLSNAGFENWTSGNPDNWGSIDPILAGFGVPSPTQETQVTPGNSGNSACQMMSQTIFGLGTTQGMITSGALTFNGTTLDIGGTPYNQNPTSYDFYYKFAPANGDTAYTQAVFTKWNTGTNSRDTLGGGGALIIGAQANFTLMNIPINWVLAGSPDSVSMIYMSSFGTPQAGTTFIIDDINMNLVTGVKEPFMMNTYTAFPNPANEVITFSTKDEKAAKVQIYDVTGRLVTTESFTEKKAKLNVESYSSGIYIYRIVDANNNELKTSKFNVAK